MPDGTIIKDVPEGTTQSQLLSMYESQATEPTANISTLPGEKVIEESGTKDSLARKVGLGARSVLEGVATPITIGSDVLSTGLEMATGAKGEPLSKAVSDTLTNIGFPVPETTGERLSNDVIGGVTGGGALGKAGQKLLTAIGGASSGAASGAARETGLGTGGQVVAGIAGGFGGAAGARQIMQSISSNPTPLLQDLSTKGIDELSAFTNVRSEIIKNAARLSQRKNNLYEQAGELGNNLKINRSKLRELPNTIKNVQKEIFDPNGQKTISNIVDSLSDMTQNPNIDVNDIFTLRRGLSKASKSSDSGVRAAAGKARRLVDDFLDQEGVVNGSPKAIRVWKNAIKSQREYSQKFEDVAEIAKAVDDATNEVVEHAFIGSGGASLNKKLSNIYDSTLKAVPSNKRKLTGFRMKQSIVNRMIKNAAQSVDDEVGVSASRLANQIRNFRRDNKSMWDKFNQQEKGSLVDLEEALRKEMKGGVINRVYEGLQKFIKGGLGQNIELPRTLKAKTVIDVDDLLELTNARATAPVGSSIAIGIDNTINKEDE